MRDRLPFVLTLFFAIMAALFLLPACDDDSPTQPKNEEQDDPLAPTTVERLLTVTFEDAYNRQDSVAYEAILDERYQFENLPVDPDDPLNVEVWDYADEMRIAGRMFSGWTNADGIKVLGITLDMLFLGDAVSTAVYDDQPEGETWYKAITEVNLLVVTRNPNASDGSGIINRVIYSNQDFIVRPDPDDGDLWVIRHQRDRSPITKNNKSVPIGSTEETNWGAVKGLFK